MIDLTDHEATALAEAGVRLASRKQWWGGEDNTPADRTVIPVSHRGRGRWNVRVIDAVGVIAVGDLQIEVVPKIPLDHFLYLLNMSEWFPRMEHQQAAAVRGLSLWDLVANWFLGEAEALVRRGFLKGYKESNGWLPMVRGKVDPIATSRAMMTGRWEAMCEYEEFDTDTALNRIVHEAARLVSASPTLSWPNRRRALAIRQHLTNVGRLRPQDMDVRIDRHSHLYRTSVVLARHIIAGHGRTIGSGSDVAWTFLIRTPELIEEGVRAVLRNELSGKREITKKRRQIPGSSLSFTPDLLFDGGVATGDVKYKWLGRGWRRSDLYQAVAFAVAFETDLAALGGFRATPLPRPRHVVIGDIEVREFEWVANSDFSPEQSGRLLAASVDEWLVRRSQEVLSI